MLGNKGWDGSSRAYNCALPRSSDTGRRGSICQEGIAGACRRDPATSEEFPHCHTISSPLSVPAGMSERRRGGGKGGGTSSLADLIVISGISDFSCFLSAPERPGPVSDERTVDECDSGTSAS